MAGGEPREPRATDDGPAGPRRRVGAGLCDHCRHQQVVPTARSAFSLCLRSREDPRFPRYPPIPVFACRGFEGGEAG
jgi:hypothetical protein